MRKHGFTSRGKGQGNRTGAASQSQPASIAELHRVGELPGHPKLQYSTIVKLRSATASSRSRMATAPPCSTKAGRETPAGPRVRSGPGMDVERIPYLTHRGEVQGRRSVAVAHGRSTTIAGSQGARQLAQSLD